MNTQWTCFSIVHILLDKFLEFVSILVLFQELSREVCLSIYPSARIFSHLTSVYQKRLTSQSLHYKSPTSHMDQELSLRHASQTYRCLHDQIDVQEDICHSME